MKSQYLHNVLSVDPEVGTLLRNEEDRQHASIRLIASENYASRAVLEATASVLSNKYSEGYAGRRYYEGQEHIDAVERLAISRAKDLFGAEHANVQPYSGSPANLAVYYAFCEPGDPILGMGLPHGGHLTHGWSVSFSGRFYNASQYSVRREDERIDFDEVVRLAREVKPKLLIAGASAYPREIDFARFAQIAEDVGAIFHADIAHISGLVAAGIHNSPVPVADVVTTTTHKTLRGPRGGMILSRKKHAKKLNRAVFPALQGGPHNHTTAGLCVALKEAATPEFKAYAQQVVNNCKALCEELAARSFRLVTGGTDNHLTLVDLTPRGVSGKAVAKAMDRAGLVCNFSSIPYDPRKPFDPSGIRLGTPAVTSRGMKEDAMRQIATWIDRIVEHIEDEPALDAIAAEVRSFCDDYPAPGLEHLIVG